MSSSNISKWFPRAASQSNSDKVFGKTKGIERELKCLANKFTTNINFNLLDYYVSYPKAFSLVGGHGRASPFLISCLTQETVSHVANEFAPCRPFKCSWSRAKFTFRKAASVSTNCTRLELRRPTKI